MPKKGNSSKRGASSGKASQPKPVPEGNSVTSKGANRSESKSGRKESGQRASNRKQGSSRKECVVVGIGASAGGLEAYKRMLRHLPEDSGIAFVLIQHLDPSHESLMAELLSKYTGMPVLQVDDAMPIKPNHVYMIPPNKFIRINDGGLFLEQPVTRRGIRLPIDYFFHSLAEARRERSICIVLSGTGSDGADGLRAVKAEGGLTIVQRPDTAEYDGMPRSAISTGAVDFILPIEEMTSIIVPYAQHPYVQSDDGVTLAETAPDHFRAIVSLLRAHTNQDFSHYKKGTLTRRIERRMGIRHMDDPSEYLQLLRSDNDEVKALFKDMLIGVTRFFRDGAAWDDLTELIARRVLEKKDEVPFRVWVPGCATGEEAYSIAMLLYEQQERQNRRLDIQVFATDIDSEAIRFARAGVYSESVAKDIPDAHIDAFFHREGDKLRVQKRLRESCVFAVQNLLADPPFSGLDLISCRNVLIYLEPEIQGRIFSMFHFSLKPKGLLFLGTSESPAKQQRLFETLCQPSRLYQKIGVSQPGREGYSIGPTGGRKHALERKRVTSGEPRGERVGTVELSKKALLEAFAPASVVVNHRGRIQYIHGPVRDYLDFPAGEPELDLNSMTVEGLRAKTRTVLHRAFNSSEIVSLLAPGVQRNGKRIPVRIRAQQLPCRDEGEPLCLVSFLDEPGSSSAVTSSGTDAANDNDTEGVQSDRELALELQATREDLQSTIEELESANEELKASNEEVMSMNEELQSTNEELETSREELQSLNEELSTVNNQLHDKVEELEDTTNDLSNLLSSTEMATLFLDHDLRIRRFTPATVRLMNLLESDIGRPLSDLAPRVEDPDMVADANRVLRDLMPVEKEVRNGGGHSYMRRITPFRTADNKIEGVVVTFSDVTNLKEAATRVEFRERQQAAVVQLGQAALAGDDLQVLFDMAVHVLTETLEVDYAKVLRLEQKQKKLVMESGVGWQDGLVGTAMVSTGIDSQAGYTLQTAGPVITSDLRKEKRFRGPSLLTEHGVVAGMSVVIGPQDDPWGVLGAHATRQIDFTVDDTNFMLAIANVLWESIRRERIQAQLKNNEARTAAFLNTSAVVGWLKDEDGRYVYWSETAARRFQLPESECLGKTDRDLWPEPVARRLEANDHRVRAEGGPIETIEEIVLPDGGLAKYLVSKFPFRDSDGNQFVGGLGVDVTERVNTEQALADSERRLQRLIDSASVGIAIANRDGEVLQANDAMLEIFGIERDEYEQQGWNWQDRVLPHDPSFAEKMKKLGTNAVPKTLELKRSDKDESTVWVLASAQPLDDAGDQYVAFLVDITAQKKAELALADSEDRMNLAARMAGFGSYYGDIERGVLTWSPELKNILGLQPDDPVAAGVGEVPDLVHPDDRERVAQKIEASLDPKGDGEFRDEHRIVRPSGEIRWILMQGRTIFQGVGEERRPVQLAGVALDITERHVFEVQLDEARRAAEAANDAKSLFLANMSHEIRTPMTAILGFADVLQSRVDDADSQACIKTIKENGDHLCQILNDILDLAKIESGKLTVRPEGCDIVAVLAHIRSLMAVRATEKGLGLTIEFATRLPEKIRTDPKMLRQILLNLVGNAIKFTEEGEIRIVVKCVAEQELIEVAVIDTGIGIGEDRLKSLFIPFEQVDNSATRSAGGTGLGLSITKKLTETLGGTIDVDSRLGNGSTFRFTIATGPLNDVEWVTPGSRPLVEAPSEAPPDQLPEIKGRVLAIDDRREIRFLVQEFVKRAGGEILTASNGEEGISTWRECRDNARSIDVVLMDIQMPLMDGLEATRRLREEGYTGPVIALTANAMRTDRENCREAGCDDFVSKPINRAELIHKLAAWLNGRERKEATSG